MASKSRQFVITPPNRLKERLTVFGREGCGKSSIILQIMELQDDDTRAHIVELDYSMAIERLIVLEHPNLTYRQWDEPDNGEKVIIYSCGDDWEEFVVIMQHILEHGDDSKDWLVIDPVTFTWAMVQSWFSEQVHGTDLGAHMVKLRKETKDIKEFNKELTSDMTWPIINKVYNREFYGVFRKWHGHSILVAEAAAVRKDAEEAEKAEFGFIGMKPKGQNSLGYVGATNVYVDHPSIDTWRYSTTKDRGRDLQEKIEFDNFAKDYLVEVAGWEMEVVS